MANLLKGAPAKFKQALDLVTLRQLQVSPLNFPRFQSSTNQETSIPPETEDKQNRLNYLLNNPPTNCCMSGCSNCLWIQYVEELGKLSNSAGAQAKEMIEKNVTDPSIKAFLLTEIRMRNL